MSGQAAGANAGASTGRRRRRGRRRRGPRQPSWFTTLLPHMLTTLNLAAGFYAIVKASEGQLERAAFALIVAGVADFLDGRAARYANSASRFGLEYDSIADTVSFGVAPAILAFNAGKFAELGWTGWVMAFTYTACAALRLARFNVSPGKYRGRFEGLPSPAAAGTVLSTVLFVEFLRESGFEPSVPASLPAFGLAALGLLMVSPIPYLSNKAAPSPQGSHTMRVWMVLAFAVIIAKPQITLFVIGVVYVLSGPVAWFIRWRRGTVLERVAAEGEPVSDGAGGPGSALGPGTGGRSRENPV